MSFLFFGTGCRPNIYDKRIFWIKSIVWAMYPVLLIICRCTPREHFHRRNDTDSEKKKTKINSFSEKMFPNKHKYDVISNFIWNQRKSFKHCDIFCFLTPSHGSSTHLTRGCDIYNETIKHLILTGAGAHYKLKSFLLTCT